MFVVAIYEKEQSIVFLSQVFQQYLLRLAVGLLHVVDEKLREIACNNPSRMFRHWQADNISACLLKGIERLAVALQYAFSQVFAQRFLLYQHSCGRYAPVDEV